MKITKTRETQMTWDQIREAIGSGTLEQGDRINIEGCDWKVLAKATSKTGGVALIWKCTGLKDHVFNESGSNVYEGSDIQKYLQNEFREDLPEEMLQMVSDEGFFLLKEEEICEYMPREIDRIATDEDDCTTWYWTASPYVGHGYHVRYINPSGGGYYYGAYYSLGVAPACWLQSLHL